MAKLTRYESFDELKSSKNVIKKSKDEITVMQEFEDLINKLRKTIVVNKKIKKN